MLSTRRHTARSSPPSLTDLLRYRAMQSTPVRMRCLTCAACSPYGASAPLAAVFSSSVTTWRTSTMSTSARHYGTSLVLSPSCRSLQSATHVDATSDLPNGSIQRPGDTQSSGDSSSTLEDGQTLRFYDVFALSSFDVHAVLVEEAHVKHGVWRNIPPQLAPTVPGVGPPTIPLPLYPPGQQAKLDALRAAAERRKEDFGSGARLKGIIGGVTVGVLPSEDCLAYEPTHLPPPFITTGTRGLLLMESVSLKEGEKSVWASDKDDPSSGGVSDQRAAASSSGRDAAEAMVELQPQLRTVPVRAPVAADALFHCGLCGRGFRRRIAAEAHVEERHNKALEQDRDAAGEKKTGEEDLELAVVLEGAGPGEITGYKEILCTDLSGRQGRGEPTAAATATASSLSFTAKPATETPASASTSIAPSVGQPASHVPTTTPSSSSVTPTTSRSAASYRAVPVVSLPDDDLVDQLLRTVWDGVALGRDDIPKAAGVTASTSTAAGRPPGVLLDSNNGKLFIPSTFIVEGTADNRATEAEALASKPVARATPEGAAPGIRRPSLPTSTSNSKTPSSSSSLSLSGKAGTSASGARRRLQVLMLNSDGTLPLPVTTSGVEVSAAPTAQELTIVELTRHYPNPFGDSPNAILLELEKEPVNPFRDLEHEAVAEKERTTGAEADTEGEACLSVERATAVTKNSGGEPSRRQEQRESKEKWLETFTARPYACPVCMRRAMPELADAFSDASCTSPTPPTATAAKTAGMEGRTSSERQKPGSSPSTPIGQAPTTTTASPTSQGNEQHSGALDGIPALDVEAWSWYTSLVPRFRLLDALEDHLSTCHDENQPCTEGDGGETTEDTEDDAVTESEWKRLYAVELDVKAAVDRELSAVERCYRTRVLISRRTSVVAGKEVEDSALLSSSPDATMLALTSGSGLTSEESHSHAVNHLGATELNGDTTSCISGETVKADAPQVHVRSAVNMVLVGTVRDIQEGFLGSTRVLQYVVGVRSSDSESSKSDASGSANQNTSNGTGSPEKGEARDEVGAHVGEETKDEELVIVRCVGDLVPASLLHLQVRRGSTVFVTGTLRMNRHVDTTSRRSHAYPYVQVVPPLGCLRVLQ